MGYDDGFYYGQGKLICTSTAEADNGKTVSIKNSAGRTWSGVLADGKCSFLLPPRDTYTISLINSGEVQYSTEVIFGYGECKVIEVGMDPATPLGIKAIVNAGLESTFFQAGDQVLVKEGSTDVAFRVLHVGYKTSEYGNNIILGRNDLLPNTKQQQSSNTNAGGYKATLLAKYLDEEYYSGLSQSWQDAISTFEFKASIGSQSSNLQVESHKVWVPEEYNIFGATTYAAATEHTQGNNEQFAYFATAANRVKSINGAASIWWLSSPNVSSSTAFCIVNSSGIASNNGASGAFGVLPCFMIAADKETT